MDDAGAGRIGSVVGRYWAMDRDRRWDRIQRAYDLLVHGRAEHRADSGAAGRAGRLRARRDRRVHRRRRWSATEARIRPGDSVFAFNFRPDRMRQITRALAEPGFAEVDRGGARAGRALRDDDRVRGGLALPGRVPARAPGRHARRGCSPRAAVRQLHVAETEKYAARDVLLQRRRGDAATRASAASWSLPRATSHLRPQAGDERAARRPSVRQRLARGRAPRSGSSTSPTPTWSATPA